MSTKSEFRTALITDFVDDENDRLDKPLVFYSGALDREITVPAGFITDYASVPRLPFAYWLAGGTARKAAVVHDFLYRQGGTLSPPVSRQQADAAFLEAMEVSGQPWLRRTAMWAAVRAFGWTAYPDTSPQKEET